MQETVFGIRYSQTEDQIPSSYPGGHFIDRPPKTWRCK